MKGWHLAGLWVLGAFLAWALLRLRGSTLRSDSTDGQGLQAISIPLWLFLGLLVLLGCLVAVTIWWFRQARGPS
jgi:hypothetical protein